MEDVQICQNLISKNDSQFFQNLISKNDYRPKLDFEKWLSSMDSGKFVKIVAFTIEFGDPKNEQLKWTVEG